MAEVSNKNESALDEKEIEGENKVIEFYFNSENLQKAQTIIARYPSSKEKSAIMPLLYLAQKQNDNWIPRSAMDYIANMLAIPPMHVYEVASFYTMYNKKPVGKYLIQICRTTPCWLCNSDEVTQACKNELGIELGETTEDKLFTLVEVECLGACVNAPVIQINDDYHEKLDEAKVVAVIRQLRNLEQSKT